MEKYIPKSFRQILAMILCVAMMMPMLPVHGSATEPAETVDATVSVEPTETPTQSAEVTETQATEEESAGTKTAVTLGAPTANAVEGIVIADGITIPAYTGGTTSKTLEYDCGNGVTGNGEKSYLTIVTGTTSAQFLDYTKLLADSGYVLKDNQVVEITSDDSDDPNRFASFTSPDGKFKLYTYHFPAYGETRIIVDTQEDTVAGFSYTPQTGEAVKPMLAMYGLSMATNGYDGQYSTSQYKEQRRNCGALVVIRMPDNSLFIHDGGDIQQWSDNACDEFLAFCRELTGVPEGEKMVINTWFLSHAHSDHFLGFPRFINKYHDQFEMKNIMYNIDSERTGSTRDIEKIMNLVSGCFDGVNYYKPHTGESFDIAGVKFDVMYALEDRFLPTEDGELIIDTDDMGGTYRGYCYDEADVMTSASDFNDTCTVLRVTFPNEVESIIYADMNRVEQTLFDIYPDDALKGDIVMVPHHGFDEHAELMAMSDATIFLYTQHKQAIYGLDNDYTTREDESVVRARLRNNFIPLMEALNETGRVEGKDYKFYWAGCETAVIDINSMSGIATLADTGSEMPSMTQDTSAPNGITVYTSEANDDLYTNPWTVEDLNDGTQTGDNLFGTYNPSTEENIGTGTTQHIRFDLVTALTVNKRYVIRSAAYPQYVMSYAAVAENPGTPNTPTSLIENEDPDNSTATNFFFTKDNYLYLDHSNRDNALWILKQDGTSNNQTLAESTTYDPVFGGDAAFGAVRLYKGIGPTDEYNADGTFKDTNNGSYWYSTAGNDGDAQYRFLDPRYINNLAWLKNTAISENIDRYVIEYFAKDGTFLIYYRHTAKDIRILTCDEDGNWKTVRYTDATDDEYPAVSEAKKDAALNTFKLKLYQYNFPGSNIKAVQFSGSTVFNLKQGMTYEEILEYIQQSIVVRDQDRRNFAIPGNGDIAKVGYYWLDFDKTFDPAKADTYTIAVKYRNDNGTDTGIATLTLTMMSLDVSGTTSYTVMEGASQADVEAMISNAITVTKTVGADQSTVSYSSAPAKGNYWLDFNVPFDSVNGSNLYTVSVKYRNHDGSDAVADTTLTVQVLPLKLAFEGTKTYIVAEGVTESAVRTLIKDSITVTRNNVSGGTETVSYAATATAGSYWLEFDGAFDSSANGDHDYFVKVWYRNANGTDTLVETVAVYVEQKINSWTAPDYTVGTVPLNSGLTTIAQYVKGEESGNITFTVNGETRYATVGLLTDATGKRVDTSKAGTYSNLTLTYMDQVICENFTLIVTESNDALNYPQKGQGGYVGVDKGTTTSNDEFKETGVANIQLSATGTPPEKGIDLIVIMDLSGSMLNEMGTNVDAVDYQNSRAVAMENSLKDMVKMLAESGQDVTIAMSDFGDVDHYVFEGAAVDKSISHETVIDINNDNGRYISSTNENKDYEFTNHLNYVFRSGEATDNDANGRDVSKIGTFANVHTKFNMAHPEYTGVIVPNVYTGSGEAEADAFVSVSDLYSNGGFTSTMDSIITQIDENVHHSLGTNYDIGLEYAYQMAYAKQQENIANGHGEERDIVCIFMSDGAAMQYNYFSGRPDSQSWSDYLLGSFESIGSTGFTAESAAATLEEISGRMLTGLQEGKLQRPEFKRSAPSVDLYANIGDTAMSQENYVDSEYFLYRMRYDNTNRNPNTSSFYGYMEDMGFDLDWEFLCAIARANGIEDFDYAYYQTNLRLPELINKLLVKDTLLGYELVNGTYYAVYQTDLVNPGLDEIQYYPAVTGTFTGANSTEKFKNAMASIGVDCTWEIYGKIAYKNRNMDISGAKDTYEIEHALKNLVASMKNVGGGEIVSYSPYPYFYNKDGKNWWAEAIKGDTDQLYPVINKYAYEDCTDQPFTYYGDKRNNYSTGTGLALDGKDYIAGFRGLDVDMYTISFSICADQLLSVETAEQVLKNVSSGPSYFFSANTEDELTECMRAIVSSMSTAATRAWFTDTMGEDYDLYIGQPTMNYTKGEAVSTIKFYENTLDDNGSVVGSSVRETITIADMDGDGDADAWSDRMFKTNVDDKGNVTYEYYDIWNETTDLITGKYVIYNASKTKTTPLTLDDSGLTYPLAPETFFWTIGVIGETEMMLEYQVYLEGSKEGTIEIPAGQSAVYDTNEEAILHYINYLGNNCTQDTVPPAFPWGNPAVGYVFYLVDQNGTPLDSQGRTTDFEHSLKLSTAVYENLNNGVGNNTTITASEKLAGTDLDEQYMLYYPNASYSVVYDESWRNDGGETTYVTQYGSTVPSNAATSEAAGMTSENLDLEKTVVYFALVKLPEPETDSGLTVNKTVEATEDANEFLLTLEAYATGKEITITRPSDIVLVLDHSGSMRTPVGAPEVLESGTLYTGEGAMTYDKLDETLGQHTGYYVAQSQSSKTWFVVRYDEATTKWFIYSVPTTESIVNIQYNDPSEGWTEHTLTQSWTVADIEGGNAPTFTALKFYKSQYAVLYDALLEFVQDLKDTGADHRVGIVGFAGSGTNGSCVYVGGDETAIKAYDAMYHANTTDARRAELYQKALKDVQDTTDYALLMNSIEAIETNYSFTCPSAGLTMASDLFAANEINLADRDRIVVLFTDGIPNKLIGGDEDTSETSSQIFDDIVRKAYASKQQGAQIYSISTTTLGTGADRTFLSYASSDYPNATSYTTPGTAISTKKYTNEIGSAAALGNIFSQITQSTESTSVELDETAILREVLSDYFDLDNVDGREIKVYTAAYDGTGPYTDNTNFGTWKEFADATVTITPTTGRKTTIDVTGFDYQSEYLSPKGRTVDGKTYYGSKLIVQVPIRTRDGFWGGNNVPTNKYSTAVYTPADGSIPEKPVEYFPMPEANVPINVTVDAVDKTIYHNGSLDSDSDGQEFDELLDKVTIGGKDVTVNNDGTFTPQESWMDDFANASWNPDSTKPGSDLSNTSPSDYTYTVTVTPNSDGTTNKSENPSNIAGNVDGGTVNPGDLTESPESATDIGHVFVLVPEVTFKDSTTGFNTPTDGYDYTGNDYVDTEWVFMEDTKDTSNAPAASGTAPELTLTYTPNGDDVQDGAFVTDTRVDVTVSANGSDITDIVNFGWQDDCTSGDHNDDMDITEHKGSVNSNEFWVHVALNIVPDSVVIDYGLDVVIDVLSNDPHTANINPALTGIGAEDAASFGTDAVAGEFGQLSIDGSKVRYALNTDNGMEMNKEDNFSYQATYTIKGQSKNYSADVTVIPATTIYYEDNFLTYSSYTWNNGWVKDATTNLWHAAPDGTADTGATQDEDRPGRMTDNDANNVYGFDSAYQDMSKYSLGSSMMATVDYDHYAEASFKFWGTGFDIISLTSNATGTLFVDVYQLDNNGTRVDADPSDADMDAELNHVVDTYYGYERQYWKTIYKYTTSGWVADSEEQVDVLGETEERPTSPKVGDTFAIYETRWVTVTHSDNALYQVPVMQVENLTYGHYEAVIKALYEPGFDHIEGGVSGNYDLYLDAIRIYDPANDGATSEAVKDAYDKDHEGWPVYKELRNEVIAADAFKDDTATEVNGLVFIDINSEVGKAQMSDYVSYGPNNELYLAQNQAIAFKLDLDAYVDAAGESIVDQVHIGMKSENGDDVTYQIYNVGGTAASKTISTTTDMYYDITGYREGVIVLKNTSDSVLSITNLKITFTDDPAAAGGTAPQLLFMSRRDVNAAVESLNEGSEDVVPEETVPETTVPEETVPETTEPEEPETFEPKTFKVKLSSSSVKAGSKVTVTVTTSGDVEYITINGETVTKHSTNRRNGERTWNLKVKAEEAGTMEIDVVCYNAEDVASDPVCETLTVTKKNTGKGNKKNALSALFGGWW